MQPPSAPVDVDLAAILDALDPEQRAAATLPDGPAQIIAPAGSGKTTTMVARLAVLLSRGVAPERICVVTFNRDAALDLAARVARRLGPLVPGADRIEIRTLHALARQVVLDAGQGAELVADRLPLLRAARRTVARDGVTVPEATQLDTWLSALKVEARSPPTEATAAMEAYGDLLHARGAVDFDDLVVGAAELLADGGAVAARWRARFAHVCVDEFQDVDAAQLRLVRLLAAPEDNLFVVGDDDQTIYAWRLADVRRILRFGDDYPGARRVTLATNYRCPPAVVAASSRLVAHNRERFAKPIRSAADVAEDPDSIAADDASDPNWPDRMARLAHEADAAARSLCFLSRTRGELVPVLLALVRSNVRHAAAIPMPIDAPPVRDLIAEARDGRRTDHPFAVLHRLRGRHGWIRGTPAGDELSDEDHAAIDAALGWTLGFATLGAYIDAFEAARERITGLRDADAHVELATVHGSKGREWETVVLVGFEADRMPNRRSLLDADDPDRALEEERRLAYVALTRATRRLVLALDPARPSPFLAEMGFGVRG
jgi:DNA helicase II / ATP-dependent DNA helicase PcrA